MNLNNFNNTLPRLTRAQRKAYRQMVKENREKAKENIKKTDEFIFNKAIEKAYQEGKLDAKIDLMVDAIDKVCNPKKRDNNPPEPTGIN